MTNDSGMFSKHAADVGPRPIFRPTVSGGAMVLVILAVLGGLVGLASLSQATFGVGLICGSCLLAVVARIAQAAKEHRDICERLDRR